MLFRDAAAEWFEEYKQDRELRTVCIADELLRVHILPTWGEMDIRNITHDAIQAFAVSLSQHGPSAVYPQGLTRPSIKRDISILRRIFDREIHRGNVVSNPATGISLKGLPIRSREVMIFTPDEVTLLIRSARPRWFADLLILAYRTGMRRGGIVWAALGRCGSEPGTAVCAAEHIMPLCRNAHRKGAQDAEFAQNDPAG